MKQSILLLCLLFCGVSLFAQATEPLVLNAKLGNPTQEELNMITYAPDSSAEAVVLYKKVEAYYSWFTDDFGIIYNYKTRIKILKDEGTSQANVSIVFYSPKDTRVIKETVNGLNASAYNLENGSTVRTKMKKEQVFEERLDDNYKQIKFTIPQAKVGSVIEYEYEIRSDRYFLVRDWQAQEDIPTFYTEYNITVPNYFTFNAETHGAESLEVKKEETNQKFSIGSQLLSCAATHCKFVGRQLPAVKADPFVWCTDNYIAQVNMEIFGYQFPGAGYKTFTRTWEEIDDLLMADQDFGKRMKMDNPFKVEMAALHLEKMTSKKEKIAAIYSLLKSKITWNDEYRFYGQSTRQILKNGTGSNADINFLFVSMLKDAGIEAYPAVMSRRDQFAIPLTYPSLQKLSTFVVGIADTDSTYFYMDASVRDGYINVLPPVLMTNRARLLKPRNSQWVDLRYTCKNVMRRSIQAAILPDGKLDGTCMTKYEGQYAANLRKDFRTAKDSADFIRQLGEDKQITVKKYGTKGLRQFVPTVQEVVGFEKQATVNDDYIYVNPLVFPLHAEAPFKQSERKLPVEFDYTGQINMTANLTLPEGYVVDELPQSNKLVSSDGKLSAVYYVAQEGRQINVMYNFNLGQLLFAADGYAELKTLWEQLAEKNNAMMVLKKGNVE